MLTFHQTHPRPRHNVRTEPLDPHEAAMTEDGKTFHEEAEDSMRMLCWVGFALVVAVGIACWAVLA